MIGGIEIMAERVFSSERREELAKKGQALIDGSYPIPDKGALRRAIQAIGRAGPKGSEAYNLVKRHCIKRARELDAMDMLPEDWLEHSDIVEHFGVKGMRWGQRRAQNKAYRRALKRDIELSKANLELAKRTLAVAKANRNAERINRAKSVGRKAAIGVGVGAVVIGGTIAAKKILSGKGSVPISKVHEFPFTASGKNWSVKANDGHTFEVLTKLLTEQRQG